MTPRDDATERQVQAASPHDSTWLSANAGSGKTRVLTDRVARLLLNGTQPQRILCLTYTKAAASEMQNRLFQRLGEWAMLPDNELRTALQTLGETMELDAERLANARTLFAQALETPGGLKIQTIHSFCSSLLRRFPLEAGVSPQFQEMEDRAADLLRREILEDIASGENKDSLDQIAIFLSDQGLDDLTKSVLAHRDAFNDAVSQEDLERLFGLPRDFNESRLLETVFNNQDLSLLATVAEAMRTGSSTDQKNAAKLATVTSPDLSALKTLEEVLLTGPSAKEPFSPKIDKVPTKSLATGILADHMPTLNDLMMRVAAGRQKRVALHALAKTKALHRFAEIFLPEYAARKVARGWLDFDDLISKSRQLLNDPNVASWVLFRLDGGIDHILVDEAQDTSPEQWSVIENLAQEFTSGEGARPDTERTIFVVGDKKQSIYSFQGADPGAFDRIQLEFGNRLQQVDKPLQDLTLEYSFRSAPEILTLVDLVFEDRPDAGFAPDAKHRAFKSDLPGRVDIWPVIPKTEETEDRPWFDPVDRRVAQHHDVVLAEHIAQSIKTMIDRGETIPVDGEPRGAFHRRPVHAGDFLILVQSRRDLFSEIIRACKALNLPIAGADRLKVGAEIAVKDLAAVLSFLATPEDSLSLACALRSPLFGWSESDLFHLAHYRDGPFLWPALRENREKYPRTFEIIDDLMRQLDFMRPYDLIERILTRHHGRKRLLARLGPEAEDGINALLGQALAYERTEIPSLTGFVTWMQADDLEIKRQMGAADGQIRVMTVHGAKGLEAPIVILPDTGPRRAPTDPDILYSDDIPLWRVPINDMPDAMRQSRDAHQTKQMNERERLLYVALTRAEKWLIVATAGDLSKTGDSWYQKVFDAAQQAGAQETEYPNGTGLRLMNPAWMTLPATTSSKEAPEETELPDVFQRPAPEPVPEPAVLSPSDLGGAKALAGEAGQDPDVAMARGTAIHRLLEHLPPVPQLEHQQLAARLLSDLSPDLRTGAFEEAARVLSTLSLANFFGPEVLVETSVTGSIHGQPVFGTIDRLIVKDDSVIAVDIKSNAVVPNAPDAIPEGILRQMAAYFACLSEIYPNKTIKLAVLWTKTAEIMYLPHDLVTNALTRIAGLDAAHTHS